MTPRRGFRQAPSILAADCARLGDDVPAVLTPGADRIHFNVMLTELRLGC